MLVRWFPQWNAVGYSRWIDRSIHLCFRTPRARFPRTRLLSHVPIVISILPGTRTTGWACDLGFGASPLRGIAPSRQSVGLALIQRYSLRSRPHDRPHVSVSEALLSALASGSVTYSCAMTLVGKEPHSRFSMCWIYSSCKQINAIRASEACRSPWQDEYYKSRDQRLKQPISTIICYASYYDRQSLSRG